MDICFRLEVPPYHRTNQIKERDKIATCTNVNSILNKQLVIWKNKLNNVKNWDVAKRISNKYEFIFSSGYTKINLVKKKPLSRSHFKLWEVLHDFNIIQEYQKIKTAHIADGPGGFIECICEYLKKYNIPHSSIDGITLRSKDKKIPNWKVSKENLKNFNIGLHNGCIYDCNIINDFVKNVGSQSVDFITADGGFDFSSDFNSQETQSYRLMFCEIYIALKLQKINGNFLLKVFDFFSSETIALLALCVSLYENAYIIKPNTSRPANSEKYLLFNKFVEDVAMEQTTNVNHMYNEIKKESFQLETNSIYNYENFYKNLTIYNVLYTTTQINYIKDTLELSKMLNDKIKNNMIEHNLKLCRQWCKEYNIDLT